MRLAPAVPAQLLLALPAAAAAAERDYPVSGFRGVDLRGPDQVTVRTGAGFSVHASGPDAALDALTVTREGDMMVIRRRQQQGWSWGWSKRNNIARLVVTLPAIERASVSGSGDLAVDRASGPRFAGQVRGSGDLRIGTLAVEQLSLAVTGSGDIRVSGKARSGDVSVTGSGNLHGEQLHLDQASVAVRGSGDVRAVVQGPAQVSIAGSGDVDLGPGARCTVSKVGSGDARCG